MNAFRIGAYVTHAKLPELGAGEITATDGQSFVIRFASGERNFICALTEKHLSVTIEGPVPAPAKKNARAAAKPRALKKPALKVVVAGSGEQ